MAKNNSSSSSFKGRCTNENYENGEPCPMRGEIQEFEEYEEHKCRKCGAELEEVRPKPKSKLPMYLGIGALLMAVVIGVIVLITNRATEDATDPEDGVAAVDSVVAEDPAALELARQQAVADSLKAVADSLKNAAADANAAKEAAEAAAKAANAKKTSAPAASTGTKNLGYAVFSGKLKNGQPNDTHGTMRYSQQHQIDPRDPKHRVAEAGDYVIGEWVDGKLVQGIWYDSSNTVKGSIMIGQ